MTSVSKVTGIGGTGAALLDLALLFYVVGYSSPYWLEKKGPPNSRSGLWVVCTELDVNGGTNESLGLKWKCHDTKQLATDWNSSWVPGVRALCTLGLLAILASVILSNIYVCDGKMVGSCGMVYSAMCTTFAAWFFTLTGIIVKVIKRYDQVFEGFRFSWAFGMCVVACILVLVAAILFFVEFALLNTARIDGRCHQSSDHGNFLYHRQRSLVDPQYSEPSSYPDTNPGDGHPE